MENYYLKNNKTMKPNYFTVHKNKIPKKAKYSKPYSKLQLQKMQECTQFFIDETNKIKKLLSQ